MIPKCLNYEENHNFEISAVIMEHCSDGARAERHFCPFPSDKMFVIATLFGTYDVPV
jgi:hypothetical protein